MRTAPESTGLDRPGDLFRLWVEFDHLAYLRSRGLTAKPGEAFVYGGFPPVWVDGCGVSGYDEDDCLTLLSAQVSEGRELPPVLRGVPMIDVSTLPKHVRDRMGVSVYRGVWFPALNREPPH